MTISAPINKEVTVTVHNNSKSKLVKSVWECMRGKEDIQHQIDATEQHLDNEILSGFKWFIMGSR